MAKCRYYEFQSFTSRGPRPTESLDIAQERLFKKVVGYFRGATRPCVVAYGYARIRRLVRPGAWFYRFRVVANSATRLGTLMNKRRMTPFITHAAHL
jgi:hypothetical protein